MSVCAASIVKTVPHSLFPFTLLLPLRFRAPICCNDCVAASVSFVYDPSDPVPTLGGNNLLLPQCGPWDQAELEKRQDVVTFTSAPLTDLLVVSGEMKANLFVSTNCTSVG